MQSKCWIAPCNCKRQALREFFEPELNEALENKRKEMILNALKVGSSAEDISRVMGIPLAVTENY